MTLSWQKTRAERGWLGWMMIFLLVAGIVALAAGLLAILMGIPIKEFGFGNTMILSGVIGACTGLLIICLWVATREIRSLGLRLAGTGALKPEGRDRQLPPLPADGKKESPRSEPSMQPNLPMGDGKSLPISVTDLPPPDHASPLEGDAAEPVAASAEDKPADPPKRRNLLFSSMSKRERERKGVAEDASPEGAGAPRSTFDDAWPERSRPDLPRRPRPSIFPDKPGEKPAGAPPAPPAPGEAAAVTVLKSGVVDGMAYSLYSDGSIEAQMPEGMMRFASIDELRAHLEHRP